MFPCPHPVPHSRQELGIVVGQPGQQLLPAPAQEPLQHCPGTAAHRDLVALAPDLHRQQGHPHSQRAEELGGTEESEPPQHCSGKGTAGHWAGTDRPDGHSPHPPGWQFPGSGCEHAGGWGNSGTGETGRGVRGVAGERAAPVLGTLPNTHRSVVHHHHQLHKALLCRCPLALGTERGQSADMGTLSVGQDPWVTYPLWPEGLCCLCPRAGALPAALWLQPDHPQVGCHVLPWRAAGVRLQRVALGL